MTVVVPHIGQSLDKIIKKPEFFNLSLYKNHREEDKIELKMPKLKIESTFDLYKILNNVCIIIVMIH